MLLPDGAHVRFPKMRTLIRPLKSAHPVDVKFNREWWVNAALFGPIWHEHRLGMPT